MLKPIFVAKTQSAFLRAKEFLKHPLYSEAKKEILLSLHISMLIHNTKIIEYGAIDSVNPMECAKVISGFSAATRKKFLEWLDSTTPSPHMKCFALDQLSAVDLPFFDRSNLRSALDSIVKASISLKGETTAQLHFHSIVHLSRLPEPFLKDKSRLKTFNRVLFAASEYAPVAVYPLLLRSGSYQPACVDKVLAALWHANLFGGSQNFKLLAKVYMSIDEEKSSAISEIIVNTYDRGALTKLANSLWKEYGCRAFLSSI